MHEDSGSQTAYHLDPLVAPVFLERKRLGLTQEELANMAGLSRRALSQIERGGDCTLSTLRNLYTALGLEVVVRPQRRPTLEDQIRRNEAEFQSHAEGAYKRITDR